MRNFCCYVLAIVIMTVFADSGLAQENPDCPGAPTALLIAGGMGQVTPGDPNNLRDQPSQSATVIGIIPGGDTFRVVDGPVCADGYNWWQVDYGGQIGWTVEGSGTDYFLTVYDRAVPTATPVATLGPVQDFVPPLPYTNHLAIGAQARVISDVYATELAQFRLHTEPGLSAPTLGAVVEGEIVTIEDGPQEVDGLRWWQVLTGTGLRGWIIEGQPGKHPDQLAYDRALLALCTPPEPDRIAFIGKQYLVYDWDFNGYIYTANPDGSEPCIFDRLKLSPVYTTWVPLAFIPWKLFPSPDNRQIAYADYFNNAYVLYTMRHDGTRQQMTSQHNIQWMDWSPDGSRLLYTVGGGYISNVWTQRPDGGARGALTSGDGSKSWATWLPDNETVVFIDQTGARVQLHGPTETNIWRIGVLAGGLQSIITLTDDVRAIKRSPDGHYLFITGFTQQLEPIVEVTGSHTIIIDIDSGELVYEDDNLYRDACWSRDSQQIIYPLDGMPAVPSPDPITLAYIPVLGGETFTVETDIREHFDILRWLDDKHVLIYLERSGMLMELNIGSGTSTHIRNLRESIP